MDAYSSSDPTQALASYVKALDGTRAYPGLPCSSLVADQARSGVVQAFSLAGAPNKAWMFFRAKSDEREATDMLLQLIAAYRAKGDLASACTAASAGPSDGRLENEKRGACASH